ncbi:MAG: HTH-type transcriptional regulator CysB [Polycyclovorans sp.]|jgi:LysR family cys regulon transcriptional activator|nr:HTH-type transcriptional regulator CysB [Gammaproteobacteria bacterium]MDP1541610.1 HTH-type transcriptional regulator CysB [Polycyclovorans sp.]|tara:strand:- start:10240 stop:11229 length:990 start_codon:yes stop_codon:yes gene_type:complete
MKLRQLHYIHEVARRGLNITAAAESMFTSQPGISKQIRLLEDELGVEIFVRNGKHLAEITPAGQRILEYSARLLQEADNILNVAAEFKQADRGDLAIATTHTQARYSLPPVITTFRERYPRVALHLHQGSPPQIAKMAAEGEADFAIATEAIEHFEQLVMLPCYRWNRCVLVRPDHRLAREHRLTLARLAEHPIVTYTFGFTGRSKLDQAFAAHGLRHDVVLTAVDADVIKTYVRLGLGVGIVADMAYDPEVDTDLVRVPADHLFEPSVTHIGFRRGLFLRGYMLDFIHAFAPHLNRETVESIASISDPETRAVAAGKLLPAPAPAAGP